MKSKFFLFGICLLIIFSSVFCDFNKEQKSANLENIRVNKKDKEKDSETISQDKQKELKFKVVNLYFYSPYYNSLKSETRKVFDLGENSAMIKQVLRSLKLGPVSKLKPTVPENIEFKDVFIYKGIVYIDLHKNKSHSSIGGVRGERIFIKSVVKTVLSLSSNYKKVKFLIDGEETPSVMGHIDCSKFFAFRSL